MSAPSVRRQREIFRKDILDTAAEQWQASKMKEILDAIERASDPFSAMASLRLTQRESFDDIATELAKSRSTNPGLWRYLSMHFIRSEQYDGAAVAADKHLALSQPGQEAFLRRYRIALLAADQQTARRMLEETRERFTDFQFACSRLFYLQRFNGDLIKFDCELRRLRSDTSLEVARALLRELSVDAENPDSPPKLVDIRTTPSGWNSLGNTCRFARLIAVLEGVSRITILGNGGSLRGSKLGKYIDAQEFVVRINFPKISALEDDVGTRTDLVFFTEAFLHTADNVLSLKKLRAEYSGVPGLAIDAARTERQANVTHFQDMGDLIALVPVEIRTLLRALSYDFATTGLCSLVFLSVLLRKKIEVHGFDFYSSKTSVHYFTPSSSEAFIGHENEFERFVATSIF